jgi:hypothetical protein
MGKWIIWRKQKKDAFMNLKELMERAYKEGLLDRHEKLF